MFFVYILKCNDGTFYTGSTNDLERRLFQHNNLKKGAHYTKIRRPVVLVYFEEYKTVNESRKREYQVKKMSRKEKVDLIKSKIM